MTYEYRCTVCKHRFIKEMTFREKIAKRKVKCPNCKGYKTEHVITPPSIRFKGSGFYITDKVK